jgi:hypothetical protein
MKRNSKLLLVNFFISVFLLNENLEAGNNKKAMVYNFYSLLFPQGRLIFTGTMEEFHKQKNIGNHNLNGSQIFIEETQS